MQQKMCSAPIRALSLAAFLACLTGGAQAQVLSNLELLAKGSYKLGADPKVDLQSGPQSFMGVDVLDFPSSGANSAGLHSYGDTFGTFGSRSSGFGVYDVTGAFQFKATITNTDSQAHVIKFNFYITPGNISNEVNATLTGPQFVEAGTSFNIAVNGNSVWASSGKLRSDQSGLGQFQQTGTNLYGGSGLQRVIAGGNFEIDLGVLDAGSSMDFVYDLSTYASGNSPAGTGILIPEQTFTVPEQWVDFCGRECGYGNGYGTLVPGDIITIPGYMTDGSPGGSHASSGDPFTFGGNTVAAQYFFGTATLPAGQLSAFSFAIAPVPEPESWALLLAGLSLVTWMARRRRGA